MKLGVNTREFACLRNASFIFHFFSFLYITISLVTRAKFYQIFQTVKDIYFERFLVFATEDYLILARKKSAEILF